MTNCAKIKVEGILDPDFEYEKYENDEEKIDYPPRKKGRKKWLVFLVIFLALLIIVFFAYLGYLKYKFNKMIAGREAGTAEDLANLSNPGNLRGETTGDVNVLFIGMRDKDMEGAYLSSAMMVVNLDIKKNQMNLISVPRDLWVPIDGKFGKANSIYKTAATSPKKYPDSGLLFVTKTFSDILGININYIFVCDFDSFEKIINRIGKVEVTMSEEEAAKYPFLQYNLFKNSKDKNNPTLYRFDGEQSFVFVSWPKDAVPDFDRLRRMQLYIISFTKQYIKASAVLDPAKASDVLNISGDNIKMDMQLWEISKIVSISEKIPAGNITQHKLTTDTGTDGGLLRESHYFNTTYNPIVGDSDFSQIHAWAKNIINN